MKWEYTKTSEEATLPALGNEGWEVYAALKMPDRRAAIPTPYAELVMFYLKRPVAAEER